MQSVHHKWVLSVVGGVSGFNIQLTCFQIIYREKMKIKSSNKSSFHSLAYKEKDSVKRWEGKPHCAGPLKSYFQFAKCVIWLGKWASMCIRSAGSLIKEMPSLLQPLWAAFASTSDLKQSGWLNPEENSINFCLKFSLIWSLLLCLIPKERERRESRKYLTELNLVSSAPSSHAKLHRSLPPLMLTHAKEMKSINSAEALDSAAAEQFILYLGNSDGAFLPDKLLIF